MGGPGQSIGRDGDFATAFQQTAKNTEQRLDLLRALRANGGSDLGPIDAEFFVQVVYRNSVQEIRSTAQAILLQQFASGPAIAMEMLDQFAEAPVNETTSETIQGFTGQQLPPVRSASWAVKARLALVQRVMSLRPETNIALDELTVALTDSYFRRLMLMRKDQVSSAPPHTPQEAAALLVQAWMERAATAPPVSPRPPYPPRPPLPPISPVPDDYPGLQRRHMMRLRLAEGPIQNFVAQQLAILDLLTYITVAEQPAVHDAALEVLRKSSETRSRLPGVLEQAVEAELALARLWKLRIVVPDAGGNEPVPVKGSSS